MASIRLESICCQFDENSTGVNPHQHVNLKLHYQIYNSICLVSAIVSIIGSIYQIFPRPPILSHRSSRGADSAQRQTSIINWLAVADLLASIGILVRAVVWLGGYGPSHTGVVDGRHIFCAVISAWIQVCYICTYFWTMCYALDVFRAVHDKPGSRYRFAVMWKHTDRWNGYYPLRLVCQCGPLYHVLGWVVPGLLCLIGLIPFYTPGLTQCGTELLYALPHYLVTYVPILMVMIGNPIIYYLTQREVQATLRSRGLYTNQERQILKSIQTKFLLVMIVFYVCWTANIIDGILIIFRDRASSFFMIAIWHFMALVNPLQSFLNSLVYRGVGGCRCCRRSEARSVPPADIQAPRQHLEESTEVSPLLSFRKSGHISSRSTS